jgi:hypothetical protein
MRYEFYRSIFIISETIAIIVIIPNTIHTIIIILDRFFNESENANLLRNISNTLKNTPSMTSVMTTSTILSGNGMTNQTLAYL